MSEIKRTREDMVADIVILNIFIVLFNLNGLGDIDKRIWSDLMVGGYMFYLGLSSADKKWSLMLCGITGVLLEVVLILSNHMTTMDFLRTGIAIMQPIRSNVILLIVELILINLINYTIGCKVGNIIKRIEKKGRKKKKEIEGRIETIGFIIILLIEVIFIIVIAILYILMATGASVGYTLFDLVHKQIGVSIVVEFLILLLFNIDNIKKRIEKKNEKGNDSSLITDNAANAGVYGEQRADSEGNKE